MAKVSTHSTRVSQGKQKRKGVHAKSKSSKLVTSKNYQKKYRGQGR